MKKLIITCVAMAALSVQSAVIMDASTLNGSFDSGTGTGDRSYEKVNNWFNAGSGAQTLNVFKSSLAAAPATGYNAVVQDTNLGGNTLHTVDTGYTLQSGDYFNISYDWRDASGWEANDQVRVAVVAYDNNNATNGTEVMRMWVNDKVTTSITWESVTGTTDVIAAGAVGKTLFIQAYAVNGGGGGDYARIDNIVVEQIPEPATLGLVAAFGGAVLFIRRRFMI